MRVKIGIRNGQCICEHLFCDNFAERLNGSFSNIISSDEDGLTATKYLTQDDCGQCGGILDPTDAPNLGIHLVNYCGILV